MHSPSSAIFKHLFDEYNFFTISNPFDNDKPYTLSMISESKMREQTASYLVKHSDLEAKNLNKICLKIVQKVLKWRLQYVNSQKFSGGACPRTPLELFLFSICFKIILPEKTTLVSKISRLPLPENFLSRRMKTFFKGLFLPFLGLTIFVLSEHST